MCEECLKIIYRKRDLDALKISIGYNPNGLMPLLLQSCSRSGIFASSIPDSVQVLHRFCYRLFLLSITHSLR